MQRRTTAFTASTTALEQSLARAHERTVQHGERTRRAVRLMTGRLVSYAALKRMGLIQGEKR
jgi:hypothetical protein